MTRCVTPFRLLITAVLVIDLAALGAHEVSVHSAPCWFGLWRVPQCRMLP
jgi:hypothetical protein